MKIKKTDQQINKKKYEKGECQRSTYLLLSAVPWNSESDFSENPLCIYKYRNRHFSLTLLSVWQDQQLPENMPVHLKSYHPPNAILSPNLNLEHRSCKWNTYKGKKINYQNIYTNFVWKQKKKKKIRFNLIFEWWKQKWMNEKEKYIEPKTKENCQEK